MQCGEGPCLGKLGPIDTAFALSFVGRHRHAAAMLWRYGERHKPCALCLPYFCGDPRRPMSGSAPKASAAFAARQGEHRVAVLRRVFIPVTTLCVHRGGAIPGQVPPNCAVRSRGAEWSPAR